MNPRKEFDTSDPSFDASSATRDVAEKGSISDVKKAIRLALEIDRESVYPNTQSFNRNRYTATADIADYDALKDRARSIKEQSIERLPELIETVKETVSERGGHVHMAEDGEEAKHMIRSICEEHEASRAVKSKSMTSEEIHLNDVLEEAGMEVMETDLAEFILQIADEPPSHIVAPAIHRTRERISELFKRTFDTDEPLDTGEELTRFARNRLREKFIRAEVGITGANIITAEDGSIMLVESEGNIRMVTQLPPVHIALSGVEKLIPSREELGPFLELLAPSGTGQPLTSYTNVLQPPLDTPVFSPDGSDRGDEQEFHLILMDNGRFAMRDDEQLREALYCIRCSACLNSCANFQVLGGHAFGGSTYSGGIGGSWEAGTGDLKNAHFSELCTGCSRCVPQCPVRIDIPWLNAVLRDRLNQSDEPDPFSAIYKGLMPEDKPDTGAPLQKQFFGRFHEMAEWGSRLAPLSNWISDIGPIRSLMETVFGVSKQRKLPSFASRTLRDRCRLKTSREPASLRNDTSTPRIPGPTPSVVLMADPFTNYTNVDWGKAVHDLYRELNMDVEVSDVLVAGRSALSQGMIETATRQARESTRRLDKYIENGHQVVIVEPSVLAMYKLDNRRLLKDMDRFERVKEHVFGPINFLDHLFSKQDLLPEEVFGTGDPSSEAEKLFYHSHCQQRTIDLGGTVEEMLGDVGFDVNTSSVECCGMAGSFGYKSGFYEVSTAVSEHLFDEMDEAFHSRESYVTVASGVSCREQIRQGTGRRVLHPAELLLRRLR